MALVRRFGNLEIERPQLHQEVEAKVKVFEHDGRYLIQINTYGREERDIPGKTSQSLQFDAEGIAALRTLLSQVP